jgi:WD40 repeat protein
MHPDTANRDTSAGHCLVVVLGPGGKPVGEAIIAGKGLIVTCAHVVNVALGRDKRDPGDPGDPGKAEFMVRFPFSGGPGDHVDRRVTVDNWLPDSPGTFEWRDAAAVRMTESLPPGAGVPTLVPPGYESGRVMLFGPGSGLSKNRTGHLTGELLGPRDPARYQVNQDLSSNFRARGGFSGGPVWDRATRQVVGMVQAIPTDQAASDIYVLGPELIEEASRGALYQVRECPYVGLRPYTSDDASRFFGRGDFVDTLLDVAREQSLIVVTGGSGYGKSSVVLAGLVPELKRELTLAVGVCKLSETPVEDLVGALRQAAGLEKLTPKDFEYLQHKILEEGLQACAAYVRGTTGADRLLLVLDQFERIENCQDPKVRDQLLNLLGALVDTQPGPCQVILTVRSDFHYKFAHLEGPLGAYFQTSATWLGPITATGLREAIMAPANTLVDFEDGLVDEICEDFRGSELPHLQIVLTRLWERQVGHELTFAAYRELGGVERALAHYADDCIHRLGKAREEAARRVLTKLVVPDTTDIARQVKRGDLRDADWPVVEELYNARLVSIRHPQTWPGEEVVEIAHEALLRKWDRFRTWLDLDAELRRWLAATAVRRDTWLRHSKDEAELLRGPLLAQATEMATRCWADVAGLSEFIRESEAAAARAELERRRLLERAEAVRLAGQSEYARNAAPSRLPVALALGIEALERHEVLEADFAIRRALALAGRQRARISHADAVRAVAFNADGTLLATASADCTCAVWDTGSGAAVASLPHPDRVSCVAFRPEAELIATAGADGVVRVWDFGAPAAPVATSLHEGPVAALAFSPDGAVLASASNDRTVRVWAYPGDEVTTLQHDGPVTALAFSPSGAATGTWLVTGSDDGEARLWDLGDGTPIASWQHGGPVRAVAVNDTGTRIATASDDRTARIFDPVTKRWVLRLMHQDRVTAVDFSADGRYLATANEDGTARVWDVDAGFELAHLVHQGQVAAVRFSPDGSLLATASRDGTARIWSVAEGSEIARLVHESEVYQVVFAADGATVATASEDGTARLWVPAAGAELVTLAGSGTATAIGYSSDGVLVAMAGDTPEGSDVYVRDAATGALAAGPLRHPKSVSGLAFGGPARGPVLATACDDGRARLWDLTRASRLAELLHRGPIRSVAFDPDGTLLATASNDGTAKVWDVRTGEQRAVLAHTDWVGAAVFSPDGTLLATAGDDKVAALWKVASFSTDGGPEPLALPHDSAVYDIVFDHDGQRVATVANDGMTRIWDTATGELRMTVDHGSRSRAAFSPDGSRVATAGDNGTVQVWQSGTGMMIARFVHEPAVRSLAFSPDSLRLATAGTDGSARIWCMLERTELARLIHGGDELVMAFSPDGRRLATAGTDGTGKIWALSREELLTQARDRLTRPLTEAEQSRYLPNAPDRAAAGLPQLPPV